MLTYLDLSLPLNASLQKKKEKTKGLGTDDDFFG
jgi:hypothetical protein